MIKFLNIYIFKPAVFSEYIRIAIVMFSKRIAKTLGGLGSEVLDGMRGSVLRTISRDFSGGRKTVLITGASRGIGYAITKLITNTLDSPAVYGTSRNSAEQLTDLVRCVRIRLNNPPSILSNLSGVKNIIYGIHGGKTFFTFYVDLFRPSCLIRLTSRRSTGWLWPLVFVTAEHG